MRRAVFLLVPLMLLSGCKSKTAAPAPTPSETLAGVQTYSGLSQKHLGKGEYGITSPQSPPVGGAHSPVWLKCQAYTEELPKVNAVHSLEHGAVWVTSRPDLRKDAVEKLKSEIPDTYVIGMGLGKPWQSLRRRLVGVVACGAYVISCVWLFFFFWPLYTAQVIPYADWAKRMWFPSWI